MNVREKRRIGRRFLAVALSVCMLFTVQPDLWDGVMVQAAEKVEKSIDSEIMTADDSGQHTDHTGWQPLTDNTPLTDGKYYLSDDKTMGTITVKGNVTLCLNGQTLTHDDTDGSVIVVESGTFTLCDCSGDNNGHITGGNSTGENNTSGYGGGIYVCKGARLIMRGGTIRGNTAKYGGGISIGAGNNNADTYFTMSGGVIEDNTADSQGGGIFCGGIGKMTITNGVIRNNTVSSRGAGIFAGTAATVNLLANGETDKVSICGNKVVESNGNGGGYTDFQKAILKIKGNVNITGNERDHDENNIALLNGRVILLTDELTGSFGVTTWNAPYSENNTDVNNPYKTTVQGADGYEVSSQDLARISSDNTDYSVLMIEGNIVDAANGEKGKVLVLGKKDTGNLSGMDLSIKDDSSDKEIELNPKFAETTYEYSVTVPNSVKAVGIKATPKNADAVVAMTIQNADNETDTTVTEKDNIPLADGENTIKVIVTEGDASKVYIVTITREEVKGNPVTITTLKDGTEWTNPPAYKLTSDNGSTFITDLAAVPDGTYKICSGDTDTGVTVIVEGKEATATVEYHTVTFKDGNTEMGTPAQQTVLKGTAASKPENPTKEGYTFSQWVTADGGSTAYDFTKKVTEKTTVYASWTPTPYKIEYQLDGGTADNPASYTIESNDITLTNPTKEGYTFSGWSGTGLDENTMTVTIPKGSTGPRTYTAHWTVAEYTVTLHKNGGTGGTDLTSYTFGTGAAFPTNWTKKGYVFGGWYANADCSGAEVKEIPATATGNKEYWAKWTDNIAPVIGTLTYNYQPQNLWQWLIGKDSLVITVPVTEEGSGADKINYTVTSDGGTAEQKTAEINNGKAEITLSPDFKGTVSITCTDKAGNISAGVTVGAGTASKGIILEDNAPEIAFQAGNAELLSSGEYKTAPDVTVTITDNKNNAISAGIASVSYQIGNGSVKTVDHNYTADMVVSDSFTIKANEIPADGAVISVTATDNAGNSRTATHTVKIHTHSVKQSVPEKEATCTTGGNKAYVVCSCGKYFSDSTCTAEMTEQETITEAKGHDFAGKHRFDKDNHWQKCSRCPETTEKEAHQFEADGTNCTVCDYEKAGEGHIHSGELQNAVEPTCTEKGNTAYYTCACGSWFTDSACTDEITDQSKIEIKALGHNFAMEHDQSEHWQECSRCHLEQSRGEHIYDNNSDTDCNECGYERTIEHTHSGTFAAAKPATCTEDGNKAYYKCSCGKYFSDSACTSEMTEQEVAIKAKGHTEVTDAAKAATCTETGLTQGSHCSVCGQTITAQTVTTALGHDFSGIYEKDEKHHWKKCSRCEETEPKAEHSYDNDADRNCNVCGYERTIENPPGETGTVSKDVEKDEKAPDTTLSTTKEELADIILTEEEKAQIENGTDIKFILDVKDAEDTVSSGDKAAVQAALSGETEVKGFAIGQYLDISLFKIVGENRSAISQTSKKLTIVIDVPDSLRSKDSTKPRTYAIVRVHDGVAEVLADLDSDADTITIVTDRFSAYAIVYKQAGSGADVTPTPTPGGGDKPTPTPDGSDKPTPTPDGNDKPSPTPDGGIKPSPTPDGEDNVTPTPSPTEASGKEKRTAELHSGLKAVQTGKKLQISWGRVGGADGYSVYVQYCGKDFSAKSLNQVKSGKKTKTTVKKVNGKKLDTTKNFKLYVVAWKWKNGKKSTLAKTLTIHIAGKDSVKYTNVKSIKMKKTSYTLTQGGTVTLHPKAVLYDKRKKQLSVNHTKEFRYLSSNKKVAVVTAGGKVKAKGPGSCTIYVFAKNGCKRKIKIKVKK